MAKGANVEVKGLSRFEAVDNLFVSGTIITSGSMQLGFSLIDSDSHLILSSSAGSTVVVSGNLRVLGNLQQYNDTNQNQLVRDFTTAESFTVTVNPSTGADTPAVLTTQAASTAHGAFKTISGAIDSLPNHINHPVHLLLSDGVHAITGSHLGDFARFSFGWNNRNDTLSGSGMITVNSLNGLTALVNGLSVFSLSGNRDINLTSDPGFTANQYRGYFLRVASGTGAGQIKAIRAHSGTYVSIAGRLNGSVTAIDIVEGAATIDLTTARTAIRLNSPIMMPNSLDLPQLKFLSVNMTSSNGTGTTFSTEQAIVHYTDGFRMRGLALFVVGGYAGLDNLIIDGRGISSASPLDGRNCNIRSRSSDSSWLIRSSSLPGVRIFNVANNPGYISQVFLFKGNIDDCSDGVLISGTPINCSTQTQLNSKGISGFGYVLLGGARLDISITDVLADAEALSGALGFISLDGTRISFNDLNSDETKIFFGMSGSVVDGS
jgi:hypothetical protein